MTYTKRRCKSCETLKGEMAFLQGHETCIRCEMSVIAIKWDKHKIETLRECNKCHKHKNIMTEFFVSDGRSSGYCLECKREMARIKHVFKMGGFGVYKYTKKCNNAFIFDGNRHCRKCNKTKSGDKFTKTSVDCRLCYTGSDIIKPQGKERLKIIETDTTRVCVKCNTDKLKTEFSVNSQLVIHGGLNHICKNCVNSSRNKRKLFVLDRKTRQSNFLEKWNKTMVKVS